MSFSGRKYQRSGCENVDQLVQSRGDEYLEHVLKFKVPSLCFTRIDEITFSLRMETDTKTYSHEFKLGKSFEMEGVNGKKILITYTLESDNVLMKKVKLPCGKVINFRSEFSEDKSVMVITIEGTSIKAKVFYEAIK